MSEPSEISTSHDALGAFADGGSTVFRLWTTIHRRCEVRLYDRAGGAPRTESMEDRGDGLWQARLAGVGPGARYRFVLDGDEVSDPYARWLPDGIDGPAEVPEAHHAWRHPRVARPLADHVIYELHLGTFTAEGTYAAAAARLPDLVDLGVTAIELMPLATYGGRHGWGYDGVAHFAPHPAHGTPDELRALVDAAHGHGLAVLLDVVYNHFGPVGNVLPRYAPEYFTREANVWGDAPNFRERHMRRYVLDSVRMWLEEYRIDGLRFDAVHAIVDPSDRPIVREVIEMIRGLEHPALLIAEDDRNDPALVVEDGFDAIWADDLHHAVHVTATGERDGYYASYEPSVAGIARTIERGWLFEGQTSPFSGKPRGRPAGALPAEAFVYCIQNHDQIGNRAHGDRLTALVSTDAYCAASMILLCLPMTPLLFMGQEWAASTPFAYFTDHEPDLGARVSAGRREEFKRFRAFADPAARARIPDPQAAATFEGSKLRWDERRAAPHARVLALYRAALALRRSDEVLRRAGRDALKAEAHGDVLVVRRWLDDDVRVLVANLADRPATVPAELAGPGAVLLASTPEATSSRLPPWSAVLFTRRGRIG